MKRISDRDSSFFSKMFIASIFFIAFLNSSIFAQDDLNVINKWLEYKDSPNSLYDYLSSEAYQLLDSREKMIAGFTTVREWHDRREEVQKTIWDIVGPFSEKTPLNVKITGKIKKEGYTLENLVYESLPGFYVTASLFVPDNITEPVPGILFCSGHSAIAYRRPLYQQPLLNLVKKGFVVLAFDPIGQGERLQYFNPETGESVIGGSTKEHSYPSVQVALIGKSVARYFIWDGIRGIDYLSSRSEVDPDRIGVHGLSGGGTQTAYISALDERVTAAAPACYITSYRRLIESIGVQDGEQNFYHGIKRMIDHPDFIEARVPKPTLIMATTNDFFSIQGVKETYDEVKGVYNILGLRENVDLTVDDYQHGYTIKNREAMYEFFLKHLNHTGSPEEEEVVYLTEKELQKTTTGQLATSLGGETVFSLNKPEVEKYISDLKLSRENPKKHLPDVINSARHISGYQEPSLSDKPVFTERIPGEDFVIEKYFVKGEGDYVVPYVLYKPQKANNKAIIYFHPGGKSAAADEDGHIEWFVNKGFTVLAPDLLETGELGNGALKGDAYIDNISYNMWYTAMLAGRSIVGIQASDAVKLCRLLKQESTIEEIYGVAVGEMSPVLLHSAAFDTAVSQVALLRPYSSYRSIALNCFYEPRFVHSIVPGALTAYDLPDLAAALSPAKLLMAGATDGKGEYTYQKDIDEDIQVIKAAYRYKDAVNCLEVLPSSALDKPGELFTNWIK
jgi:dienelactone hydrolase